MGASKGLENHINQLVLADLDHDLIRTWRERARIFAEGFELGMWQGPIPERHLQAFVELFEVMNTAPRDSLQIEDFRATPVLIRQMEQSMFALGVQRWIMFVREIATGKLAGFTEVTWNPNSPRILSQNGTGILREYRNKGLARWLKAAMLEKVLRERPEVKFVRTSNADTNAAKLKINNELRFQPYASRCMWQVGVDKATEYLGESERMHV